MSIRSRKGSIIMAVMTVIAVAFLFSDLTRLPHRSPQR